MENRGIRSFEISDEEVAQVVGGFAEGDVVYLHETNDRGICMRNGRAFCVIQISASGSIFEPEPKRIKRSFVFCDFPFYHVGLARGDQSCG